MLSIDEIDAVLKKRVEVERTHRLKFVGWLACLPGNRVGRVRKRISKNHYFRPPSGKNSKVKDQKKDLRVCTRRSHVSRSS
jgi:hypothetical protein